MNLELDDISPAFDGKKGASSSTPDMLIVDPTYDAYCRKKLRTSSKTVETRDRESDWVLRFFIFGVN